MSIAVAATFAPPVVDSPAPSETHAGDAATDGDAADGDAADGEVADEAAAEDAAAGGRLVVFGDLDFATDAQIANSGNALLLVNAFNWLVEREELIDIEARTPEKTRLTLAGGELTSLYTIVMLLLPGAAIVAGVWIAMARRR